MLAGAGGGDAGGSGGGGAIAGTKYTTDSGYYDVVWDTKRNHVFLSGGATGMVHVLDLGSGTWTDLTVGHHAEHMYFDAMLDQVLVSVALKDHSPNWPVATQSGRLNVIDAAALSVFKPIQLPLDPWQVVADGAGRAYVTGGSGQFTNIMVVNLATSKTAVSNTSSLYFGTDVVIHPDKTRLYTATVGISPDQIDRYDIANDTCEMPYSGPYPMGYQICGGLRGHPGGTTLYSGCGTVVLTTNTKASDMKLTGNIGVQWRDLAFRPDGKIAYLSPDKDTSSKNGGYPSRLDAVDTDSLKIVATYPLSAPAERVLTGDTGLLLVRETLGGAPQTEVEVIPYSSL